MKHYDLCIFANHLLRRIFIFSMGKFVLVYSSPLFIIVEVISPSTGKTENISEEIHLTLCSCCVKNF